MTADQIRAQVLECLGRVAPEVDPAGIAPDVPLRDQLDIDSMDFLNVIVGIHERTGIDVPEADYEHLETLDGAIKYLVRVSRG